MTNGVTVQSSSRSKVVKGTYTSAHAIKKAKARLTQAAMIDYAILTNMAPTARVITPVQIQPNTRSELTTS